MGINVNGNGNRVAGRDYYEVRIRPCPVCEERLIEPDRSICRHCFDARQTEKVNEQLAFWGICTFIVWGFLLKFFEKREASTSLEFLGETFVWAGIIVFSCFLFFVWLVHWRSRKW